MPAKKTPKKKAAKKSAPSAKGALQPAANKTINDVIKLLRDNPEFGMAFHNHFADKVLELNRSGWAQGAEYSDAKHVWGAQCITREVLDEFNLFDLVRK